MYVSKFSNPIVQFVGAAVNFQCLAVTFLVIIRKKHSSPFPLKIWSLLLGKEEQTIGIRGWEFTTVS